jgi:hypothetical protein
MDQVKDVFTDFAMEVKKQGGMIDTISKHVKSTK